MSDSEDQSAKQDAAPDAVPLNLPLQVASPLDLLNAAPPEAHPSAPDALSVLQQATAAAETMQRRFQELAEQEARCKADREQLETDRRVFRSRARELAETVAREESQLRDERAAVKEHSARLREESEETAALKNSLEEQRAEMEDERRRMRDAMTEEINREREAIRKLKIELTEQRQNLEHHRLELDRRLDDQLAEERRSLEEERDRVEDSVRSNLASELENLRRQKQDWDSERSHQEKELRTQQEELQLQRERFGEQLEAEQNRLRDEVDRRRSVLLAEQNNLQRRYQFQFDHLARAREDFDSEQRTLRRQQQEYRVGRRVMEEQLRLRQRQLRSFRDLLSQREASAQREIRVAERALAAARAELTQRRKQLETEWASVRHDLDFRSRQLDQREASVAELAARLDERALLLQKMRADLEQTQRTTLEQRLAIEEARAALTKVASPEEAERRLRQARNDLTDFCREILQQIQDDQKRLLSSLDELHQERASFRDDRRALEEWVADRVLAGNEAEAAARRTESAAVTSLEEDVARLRERWVKDRREAETTIRGLVDRLMEFESAPEAIRLSTGGQAPQPVPERATEKDQDVGTGDPEGRSDVQRPAA